MRGYFMSSKTEELFSLVDSLPIDIKTKLIERILDSLNPTPKEIEDLWKKEIEKRVAEIAHGEVKTIPAEEVFEEIKDKYKK